MTGVSPDASGSGRRSGTGPKTGDKRRWNPAMYERRRAATACQPCRMRKTKCDNQRPVCGFCQQSQGRCVWTDKAATDHSSFDPASLAILERVNVAVSLLESGLYAAPLAPLAGSTTPSPASLPTIQSTTGTHGINPIPGDAASHTNHRDHGNRSTDMPETPALLMNAESVLRWPIFRNSTSNVPSFVLDGMDFDDQAGGFSTEPVQSGLRAGRCVCEEDFSHLAQKFLAYVHVKNPILDIAEYKSYVSVAAENGPGWDGPSCIVLITCALASLAAPLESEAFTSDLGSPETIRTPAQSTIDRDAASAYFTAAQKRLGFLRPSLMHIQCLFLFGVYQMYCINAMEAWSYFNQACVQFRSLLWFRTKGGTSSLETSMSATRRLEQRLYWSCLKSELELQCEIPLPLSGLSSFDYPDPLPSPPGQVLSPSSAQSAMNVFSGGIELNEERSWFYYLAEISSRRMQDRAIAIMGSDGEQGWVRNIQAHLRQARTLLDQLDLWCSHIPGPVNILHPEAADNELAHLIWLRGMACREWLHRPFVYYAIHQSLADGHMDEVVPLAKTGLQVCVDLVLSCSPRHKHRHHGTWYMARSALTRALILLAAGKSGHIEMPRDWRKAVDKAVAILMAWGEEAKDLRTAGIVLEDVVQDVYAGIDHLRI